MRYNVPIMYDGRDILITGTDLTVSPRYYIQQLLIILCRDSDSPHQQSVILGHVLTFFSKRGYMTFYCFLGIRQRFFHCLSLREAPGQRRNLSPVATFFSSIY